MVTYELKLMRRVSITKNDSTTSGTKLSSKGCEEYLKPLSNHHTDSDPTAHDNGKNEMERQKNDSMRRRESSIDRSILAYFDLVREERFPRLRTAIHALFLPTKKSY